MREKEKKKKRGRKYLTIREDFIIFRGASLQQMSQPQPGLTGMVPSHICFSLIKSNYQLEILYPEKISYKYKLFLDKTRDFVTSRLTIKKKKIYFGVMKIF